MTSSMRGPSVLDEAQQRLRLKQVLSTVQDLTRRQVSSTVIFDLDGTLYDNRPRTHYILREISEAFCDETPQLSNAFQRFQSLDVVQYSIRETLKVMGVTDEAEMDLVDREWAKRFFTDVYQRFDLPLQGARRFVEAVHKAGATVIYLTGRDVGRMLVGTTESLRQYGFPVGVVGTMMIVKHDIETEDDEFKAWTLNYLRRIGTVVATFENEPANANMLQREFPYADTFMLQTQHRPDAPPIDPGIIYIRNFRMGGATEAASLETGDDASQAQ